MSNVNQQEKQKLDSTSELNAKIRVIPSSPVSMNGLYTMGVKVTNKDNKGVPNQRVKLSVTDPQGKPVLGEDGKPQVYTNAAEGYDEPLTYSDGWIYFTPYLMLNNYQTQAGVYTIEAYVEGAGIKPVQKQVEFIK
ncbi:MULTISPECIES: hypothetical protein [Xenorhabdus]|uniref:Invasin n=1 Tax=Xenorhabdus ehlersii TaxID=290111 RepID=A0A2D0IUQ4_9GAMM|nr:MULTISPECIES: hypothetical protein [Xenorhabdus]MBC8950476.1 hypothetical protein [Xenorhabdus sp. TS4]PHM25606.1 hypothetical protein Xehl_01233 [Xenorhabdus ehlersii]RKE87311.1 hypothetical protein BDE27_3648 [Xenorhabdus ehlersii]